MEAQLLRELRARSYLLRHDILHALAKAGSGHVTSCFSAAEIITVLFTTVIRMDPHHYERPCNDRFILSKGHAAPALYAIWKQLGMVSAQELNTIRMFGSRLEGHPTPRFPYAEGATGSLGQGLAMGAGQAYAVRLHKEPAKIYVLLGDAELSEGSNWEAFEWASMHNLSNLIAIIDYNELGQTGPTPFAHDPEHRARQLESFGWQVFDVDGHDSIALYKLFQKLDTYTGTKPIAIIARTQKGHGLPDDIAGRNGFHGKAFLAKDLPRLDAYLDEQYKDVRQMVLPVLQPRLPEQCSSRSLQKKRMDVRTPPLSQSVYAPRKAVAEALADYAAADERIICIDADVKNSTYTELVEEKAPERFLQARIAEQLMIGLADGCARRGMQAWAATFASFLTRAADQLRMSAIGRMPLRIIGTHVGVSIGADGPSQMGLEDIALFAALPHARIMYPADYYAARAAVTCAYDYDHGISYIRTTRNELPVMYDIDTPFEWGSCHVLREHAADQITIVAAGVTVHEACKAYDLLKKHGIQARVVDAYSVLPLPVDALCAHAQETQGRILVVEDHYLHGGLGSLIAQACAPRGIRVWCAAVHDIPRSGSTHDLLAWAGIDAEGIVKKVMDIVRTV